MSVFTVLSSTMQLLLVEGIHPAALLGHRPWPRPETSSLGKQTSLYKAFQMARKLAAAKIEVDLVQEIQGYWAG